MAATIIAEIYLVVAAWSALLYFQRRADRERAERRAAADSAASAFDSTVAPPTTDGRPG